jgi:hypothetical protein
MVAAAVDEAATAMDLGPEQEEQEEQEEQAQQARPARRRQARALLTPTDLQARAVAAPTRAVAVGAGAAASG